MSDGSNPPAPRAAPVPRGRLGRMARMGGLATGLAGTMAARGGMELLGGRRPRMQDLLMTPANVTRVTEELSRMRGAAMKAGQLLSMETGELMPPELAQIMTRLQSEAHFMPPAQLKKVLAANWGGDFMRRFRRFDVRPIAAASIGQVHRAQTRDGRDLAVKVQYPGIRDSIDSDIRNLGAIARGSGLVPRGMDIAPLLEEARAQLHEEADYLREAAALSRFAAHLADTPHFRVPGLHRDLTTPDILVMDHLPGVTVAELERRDQATRDRVAARLITLVLRELFDLGDMQTDPNFANYLFDPDADAVILLDFGATRRFAPETVAQYREVLRATVAGDGPRALARMADLGMIPADPPDAARDLLLRLFGIVAEPFAAPGVHDFGRAGLLDRLRQEGLALAEERGLFPVPPVESLLLQRKVLGCYLLAERLRARVDLHAAVAPWL
ncbi:MAG: AarF/ABC1/UbiB kinase family protein [Roseovarius sp.]|nr:AarF/ABC1/UbiB kinase family protein [Roseovarius sp.]